jgi:hypothetical protein
MSLLAAPPTYAPSMRGDAMLLTHGRAGTERLISAALLLDAVLGGFRALAFPPALHALPPAARAILGGVATDLPHRTVSRHTPAGR